jgi:hypothetical protein
MDKSNFELFSNSGRFTNVNAYLEKYPDAILHDKCTDVIVYSLGDCHIQVLRTIDSSEFYFNDEIRGHSLDDVELELFTKKINKQLNDV